MARAQFEVFNAFGDLLARGNSEECATAIGITIPRCLQYASDSHGCPQRWRIVKIFEPEGTIVQNAETSAMIKKWDTWATYWREYFGIPVWKPEKGCR